MSGAPRSRDELRAARLIAYPWPHLIVDNFLARSVLAKSLIEINSDVYSFDIEKRGSGRIEYSLLKSKTLDSYLLEANHPFVVFGVQCPSNVKSEQLDPAQTNECGHTRVPIASRLRIDGRFDCIFLVSK